MIFGRVDGKKYYRIGEVARFLGISTERIRYYEYENLLVPQKDEQNRYRLYTLENIIELQQLVFFREIDLSISEIKDLLKLIRTDQLQQLVNNKSLEVQEKIHSLELLLQKLRDIEETAQLIEASFGKHSIRPLPSFYIMMELSSGILQLEEEHFFKESVYHLCSFAGSVVKNDQLWTIEREFLLMRRKLASNLSISEQIADKKVIESRRGGYTIHKSDDENHIYDACESLLQWLEAEGYHPTSNFIFNHLVAIEGGEGAKGYIEVFVPVA